MIFHAARLLAAVAAFSIATAASAQNYPNRPITMIVPFAAGGTSDVIARTVCQESLRIEQCEGYWGRVAPCPARPERDFRPREDRPPREFAPRDDRPPRPERPRRGRQQQGHRRGVRIPG